MPFTIVRDDITHVHADAIVNAANEQLRHGGGVCGAIFSAAGAQKMQQACNKIGHCDTGSAVATPAFALPARYVIHTVGPVWHGGSHGERELLESCYRSSLELAASLKCKSIAFPLISAGIYGYPQSEALEVARKQITGFLQDHDMDVRLVLFNKNAVSLAEDLRLKVDRYIDDVYVGSHAHYSQRQSWESNVPASLAFDAPLEAWSMKSEEAAPAVGAFCPTCGEPVKPGAAFCPRCGSSLGSTGGQTTTAAPSFGSGTSVWEDSYGGSSWDSFELYGADSYPDAAAPAPASPTQPSAPQAAPQPTHGWAQSKPAAPVAERKRRGLHVPGMLTNLLKHMDASFSETLLAMIDERGLKDSEVYKRANLTRQHFSKIRSNRSYKPTKTTVLALAIALELSPQETNMLLERAGFALSHADCRDVIVEFFINEGIYDVFQINEALFAYDQPLLG